MATAAPDSTSWAKELKAFGRDVEASTDGQVAIKWYMGGMAGDEREALGRIGKAQLDGMASGIVCAEIAPSMRALNVPGVVQGRDEANYVSQKLQGQFAAEAQKNGFALLFTAGLGPTMVFSRTPVRTMSELRTIKLWRWELDQWGVVATREMGMPVQAGIARGGVAALRRRQGRRLHDHAVGGAGVPVVDAGQVHHAAPRRLRAGLHAPGQSRAGIA